MNEEKLRKLVKLVEESDIEAIEIRRFFRTVKITKRSRGNHNGSSTHAAPQLIEVGPAASAPVAQPAPVPAPVAEPPSNLVEIKSPMVGTYYRAPAPGSPPFIEVGKTVTPGDVLCIIEAMKLMNEIEAEQAGRISKILVEDGQPIEFGETLFLLDPTG